MPKMLGRFSKLYINTSVAPDPFATPAWTEWSCIEDLTLAISKEELERTCRGEAAAGGFSRTGVGLGSMEISGTALKNKDDAAFLVAEDAMVNDTILDIWVLDGANDSADSDGWRLPAIFTSWSESQGISDYISIDFTLKPTSSTQAVEVKPGVA